MNPVLSISSPGFQKSSRGFVKYESGFCSSPGPGFSRVRIFFESESGFRSMPKASNWVLRVFREGYALPLIDIPEKRMLDNHRSAIKCAEFVNSEINKLLHCGCKKCQVTVFTLCLL